MKKIEEMKKSELGYFVGGYYEDGVRDEKTFGNPEYFKIVRVEDFGDTSYGDAIFNSEAVADLTDYENYEKLQVDGYAEFFKDKENIKLIEEIGADDDIADLKYFKNLEEAWEYYESEVNFWQEAK